METIDAPGDTRGEATGRPARRQPGGVRVGGLRRVVWVAGAAGAAGRHLTAW